MQDEEDQRLNVPEGFVRRSSDGSWFVNPQQGLFWRSSDPERFYEFDEKTQSYTPVHRGASIEHELRVNVDASSIHQKEGVREDRHVIVRDLARAAQSLRMPIDHLERPCALFGLYDGHRPAPAIGTTEKSEALTFDDSVPVCAEFCARNFHLKLLPRLSEFKGNWDDARFVAALRASFDEVDADFLTSRGVVADGCSAVVALLTGRRLFVANVGRAAALIGEEALDGTWRSSRQTVCHVPQLPAEMRRICAAGGSVVRGLNGEHACCRSDGDEVLPLSRAFGDRAFKSSAVGGDARSLPALVLATPDVSATALRHEQRFVALFCDGIAGALGDEEITEMLRRRSGRPRLASGALAQASRARCVAAASATALCIFLEWTPLCTIDMKRPGGWGVDEATCGPPVKRLRMGDVPMTQQVRCRHILVRHRDCKEPVDRVRGNRPVSRSLADAEQALRDAIEAVESSPGTSMFTQRCKAISECSTCLKGGEMAGDLGWLSRGQAHAAVEAAAFALPIDHLSDIVESDEGVHLLWRIG